MSPESSTLPAKVVGDQEILIEKVNKLNERERITKSHSSEVRIKQ